MLDLLLDTARSFALAGLILLAIGLPIWLGAASHSPPKLATHHWLIDAITGDELSL